MGSLVSAPDLSTRSHLQQIHCLHLLRSPRNPQLLEIHNPGMSRLLCPPQLGVENSDLIALDRISSGETFLAWDGVVKFCSSVPSDSVDQGDPRLYHGMYENNSDQERELNWVRFLPHQAMSHRTNMVVSLGALGEPVFSVVRDIDAGETVSAFYSDLHPTQLIPAVQFLRLTLYRKYVERAMNDSPLDLTSSRTSSIRSGRDSPGSDGEDRSSQSSLCSSPESPRFSRTSLCSSPESQILTSPVTTPNFLMSSQDSSKLDLDHRVRRAKRMLPCDTCGKEFDRPSLLARHMRVHTGERPHVCDICNKGFSTSSSLNTHRRIHTGEKPHQCKTCGKSFTASSNLYYHKMTHINDKPHPCNLCTKSFPTPGDLRSHMNVHMGVWPHTCTVCNKGFSKESTFRSHIQSHL